MKEGACIKRDANSDFYFDWAMGFDIFVNDQIGYYCSICWVFDRNP